MRKIDLIPFGQKNRISKEELARKLNISIKEINSIVSELRKKYIIFSAPKGPIFFCGVVKKRYLWGTGGPSGARKDQPNRPL